MKPIIYPPWLIKHSVLIVLAIGFFYNSAFAALTIYPHISAGHEYTDNVDLTPENEEHEYITTVRPGLDINLTGQLSSLSLSYTPTYAAYLRFPENNTLRHNADLTASRQITRTTDLEFSNAYLYTEEPLYDIEDLISEVDTTVRQEREPYYENTATFGVINRFGPENALELNYEYYFLHNDDPTVEDREHYIPGITATYWLVPERIGTESELSYTRRTFDESEDYNDIYARLRLIRRFSPHFEVYAEYSHEWTNYVAETGDYEVYSPLLGFVWDEYFHTSFSGSLGYYFQENDGGEDEDGAVGTINTNYTWRPGTTATLSGAAGYDQASTGAENLGFYQFYSVTGTVVHPVSRHVTTDVSVGYQRNVYTDEDPDREDGVWRTRAGLRCQVLPWMIVELDYTFRKIDSNIEANDYTENRAMITVTLNPRQPMMLSR